MFISTSYKYVLLLRLLRSCTTRISSSCRSSPRVASFLCASRCGTDGEETVERRREQRESKRKKRKKKKNYEKNSPTAAAAAAARRSCAVDETQRTTSRRRVASVRCKAAEAAAWAEGEESLEKPRDVVVTEGGHRDRRGEG